MPPSETFLSVNHQREQLDFTECYYSFAWNRVLMKQKLSSLKINAQCVFKCKKKDGLLGSNGQNPYPNVKIQWRFCDVVFRLFFL